MLSIVDTWGHIQYFFKSCSAIVTTGFLFSHPHEDALTPGPPGYEAKLHYHLWKTNPGSGKIYCIE